MTTAVENPPGKPTKRAFNEGKRHFKKNKKQKANPEIKTGSNEDVLIADVRALLQNYSLQSAEERPAEIERFSEREVTISCLSSTGDGLALIPETNQVVVVPFTAPGDKVLAKLIRHVPEESYIISDFVKIIEPSPHRHDELVKCPYFSKCSGCQFQMLPYDYQLAHKRTILEKAYRHFSALPASDIPPVLETIGSPLQYGYRTKLTPHFDGPPGGRRDRRHGSRAYFEHVPEIGFMLKGTRKTLDIEDCPIGTQAVRDGMKKERQRVKDELDKYQRGATLLLRESTHRVLASDDAAVKTAQESGPSDDVDERRGQYVDRKSCITDPKAISTEYVDEFRFDNAAGQFFQNNNSILPVFTKYIRDNILPSDGTGKAITNLVDAYSGSGLFTISLSSIFTKSIGIDISSSSIDSANANAALNNLAKENAQFLAGDANDIFASIKFPADQTAVVLDPSRKGCDDNFLRQLLKFSPARICYVSCNVHTQAIDIGKLVNGLPPMTDAYDTYEIESLRGFDFFPQTSHVEGVAFLRKKAKAGVDATDT